MEGWIAEQWSELAALAMFLGIPTLVQVSPIKVNPWSWLARKIGRAINGEVIDRVDRLAVIII